MRLRQVIAGVPTTYTQDLVAPLPVVLQAKTGSNAMQYLYSIGTRPIGQYTSAWEYLLPDALGSVRQIADVNGNVTLAESYEPYGSVLTSTGSASSIFAYAGEQADTTGLIYLRARYLQPRLGIFLARDPISGDVMRPGSMNGFNYAEENPVNLTDPSGHDPWWCDSEPFPEQCRENTRSPDTTTEQQVLESTIQMVEYDDTEFCENGVLKLLRTPSASLGTLVQYQGVYWIYTHNHFDLNTMSTVKFYNARGEFLEDVSGDDFRWRMALAQDSGNAVIVAPPELLPGFPTASPITLVPKYAEFGDPEQVVAGDNVKLSNWHTGSPTEDSTSSP